MTLRRTASSGHNTIIASGIKRRKFSGIVISQKFLLIIHPNIVFVSLTACKKRGTRQGYGKDARRILIISMLFMVLRLLLLLVLLPLFIPMLMVPTLKTGLRIRQISGWRHIMRLEM